MTTTPDARPAELTLPIEGMTCASCVNRIERFLRKTPGVEAATVNLATETATIRYLPDVAGSGRARRRHRGGRLRRPHAAAGRGPTPPPTLADELSDDDLDRARASPRPARPGGRLDRASPLGIMVLMFAPADRGRDERAQPAGPRPGDVHPVLGRRPVLPRGVAGRPARHDEHGHARRGRHDRGLGLQRASSRSGPSVVDGGRHRAGDLLRLVDDHHRPGPARPLARGAGQGPDGRRDPAAGRAQPDDAPRRRRRRGPRGRRSRPSRSATCCASGRASRSRSTASSSRAARRSTSRC